MVYFPYTLGYDMNDLNCESKIKGIRIVITSVITAIVTVVFCFMFFLIVLFNIPGLFELLQLNFYVDSNFFGSKSNDAITDGILSGYIDKLDDKYARYYNEEQSTDRESRLNGISEGLGLTVIKDLDSENIYVARVYNNSPALKAGILKGDKIVKVDGQSVSDLGYSKAVDLIPREVGKPVNLTILRGSNYFDLTIVYSNIVQQTVFFEKIQNYGYIEITSFNSATVEQFYNALNTLQSENVTGLIFDLRDNGGGTVNSVGKILDRLLPEGDLVTVKYKNGNTKVMLKSDTEEVDLPMAVLVNENTASASEVFASNIREFNKGILIGKNTFGKGIMQDTFNLSNGASVVFTVAELFTHNMTAYHSVGLAPDIEVELTETDIRMRYFNDISDDKTVSKAIDWLNGEENE